MNNKYVNTLSQIILLVFLIGSSSFAESSESSELLEISESSESSKAALKAIANKHLSNHSQSVGYSLSVVNSQGAFSVTHGSKNPAGDPIDNRTLFRMASITKTFVAATVMRLAEQKQLDLNMTIDSLISPAFRKTLSDGGYSSSAITVWQLLTHTSGMYDHAQSDRYLSTILNNPQKQWTAAEQVEASIEWGKPLSAPGTAFHYSDTGYIILGHIIERITEQPLPRLVRQQLVLDNHQLTDVIWEINDSKPVNHAERAHQYINGIDTYTWHPSIDLYGGGGIVASTNAIARFYYLLFTGAVFHQNDTLNEIINNPRYLANSPYRVGFFVNMNENVIVYEHGGFWGTLAMFHPSTNTAIVGAVTRQSDYTKLRIAMFDYIKQLQEETESH